MSGCNMHSKLTNVCMSQLMDEYYILCKVVLECRRVINLKIIYIISLMYEWRQDAYACLYVQCWVTWYVTNNVIDATKSQWKTMHACTSRGTYSWYMVCTNKWWRV